MSLIYYKRTLNTIPSLGVYNNLKLYQETQVTRLDFFYFVRFIVVVVHLLFLKITAIKNYTDSFRQTVFSSPRTR